MLVYYATLGGAFGGLPAGEPPGPDRSLWEARPRGDGAQIKTREFSSNFSPSTLRKKSCES
jgi:hypothetical protein